MSLKNEVDSKRREISSDNLSMSIGELVNLYKDDELDIHPEFQRVFRWSIQQKSRLIESLLLGIPLPPIYVAVNEAGVWEVIDGVQRLSTIFEFMGELRGPASEESDDIVLKRPLVLEGTKHLPNLERVVFEKLDKTLKLEFKRTRLDVKILERDGSSSGKFDLFERLNTYGAVLSPQELRNCVLVSLNPDLYRSLKSLAADPHFVACTLLSDLQLSERYDMDLALRFIVLRDADPGSVGDVHDYLRDRMEEIALSKTFDIEHEKKLFKEVFKFIDDSVDGNAFRPWNSSVRAFRGAFALGAYEGLALAIGRHWGEIRKVREGFNVLQVIKNLWATPEYKKSFSGLRARERMARVAPAAERVVEQELTRLGVRRSGHSSSLRGNSKVKSSPAAVGRKAGGKPKASKRAAR
jgi:hypothetical protein